MTTHQGRILVKIAPNWCLVQLPFARFCQLHSWLTVSVQIQMSCLSFCKLQSWLTVSVQIQLTLALEYEASMQNVDY